MVIHDRIYIATQVLSLLLYGRKVSAFHLCQASILYSVTSLPSDEETENFRELSEKPNREKPSKSDSLLRPVWHCVSDRLCSYAALSALRAS